MNAATWLLTGFLLAAPPGDGEASLAPHLEKGLEIIWKGRLTEAHLHPTRAFRNYDLEIRALVIDVCDKGSDLGIMTKLSYKPEFKGPNDQIPAPLISLETFRVDPRGNVFLLPGRTLGLPPQKRVPIAVPIQNLQGLPSLEVGMFLALPSGKLQAHQAWNMAEEHRPPRSWKIDTIDSTRIKITGEQETSDFLRAAVTKPQWRRTDIVWVLEKTGYACKVERNIEKRIPEVTDISFRSKLVYEQKEKVICHDPLFSVERSEILKVAALGAELQRLLDEGKGQPESFESILKQIAQHEQSNLRGEYVAYRSALNALKRRVESAQSGHIPPAPPAPETVEPSALEVGATAPDFLTTELTQKQQVRLSQLRGRPIVLLYYQPSGKGAQPVLDLAQSLFVKMGQKAYVMSVAVGDPDEACKQRNDWKLNLPILAGREIYKLHGVTSTPEIAVLDDQGIVRNVFIGWTDDTADSVRKELDRWVK